MPEMFGNTTHHVIQKSESYKLHQSFFIPHDDALDVRIGMPVKLSNQGDFLIQPLSAGDHRNLCIGIAMHDTDMAAAAAGSTPLNTIKTTYGDLKATVAMKAFMIIQGGAGPDVPGEPAVLGAIEPGPVKFIGYAANDERFPHPGINLFANCLPDDDDMIGWALEHIEAEDYGQIALTH